VPKLFNRNKFGFGNLDDAIPSPNAGCIIKKGPTAVIRPIIIAGKKLGSSNQLIP